MKCLCFSFSLTGGIENATKVASSHFNDKNQEVPSLYFNDVTQCDYLVDLQTDRTTDLEPDYLAKYPDVFEEELSFDYLDSANSHKIYRAFFVPYFSSKHCKYSKYVLLKNKIREKSRIGLDQ
jgi:alpha-1,2-mannosyltransferase